MKLNLGAGDSIIPGFTNIDRKLGLESLNGGEVYPLASIADNSIDEIRASHVLEHFPQCSTLTIVRDWARALKPGGLLKIAVPNLDYAVANKWHPQWEMWITGAQTDNNDFHFALFYPEKLHALLDTAGLVNIREWQSEVEDCAAMPVSLNLCGTKP